MKYIKKFEEQEEDDDFYLISDSENETLECYDKSEIDFLLSSNLIQKDENSDYNVYFFHDEDYDEILKTLDFIRSSAYKDAKRYNL